MSYIAPNAAVSKRLQIAEITITGTPAINGYFTFNALVDHTFDSAPTGLSSDTLNLPSGDYMMRASLDITRSNTNQNYMFQFEESSSLIGRGGRTGLFNDQRADVAECTFSSNSAFSVKLKCIHIDTSAPTLTSDCRAYLWRVS